MDEPSGTEAPSGMVEPVGSTMPSSDATAAGPTEPTTQQIAQRAYEIYQARGGTEGQDIEDWLQAERELKRGSQDRRE